MQLEWTSVIKPKGIEFDPETLTSCYGKFSCEPFERGYGITVGNSLRRILLSSITGAAIVSVRIEGVQHEFSAIPGVLEDVTNIILNLKSAEDAEMIRWGNTLKHWRDPILNHFDNHTTNGFTEGCNTKIKMLKRVSYGLRNVEVYWRKMLLGFVPSRGYFHTT